MQKGPKLETCAKSQGSIDIFCKKKKSPATDVTLNLFMDPNKFYFNLNMELAKLKIML